ncbi:MAG: outer membrane protein transport protein [Desulfonatronovibrio sp.]
MNLKTVIVAAILIFFVQAGNIYSAGFSLYEWGARGTAMGGTMIGRADDPSAVAYNPAGITQLEGIQTMMGLSVVSPSGEIETPGGTTTSIERNNWIPPHAYLTYQMNDWAWLGLGVYTRFGLGTEYEDDWVGRYNTVFTRVQSASFNPNLAFKLSEKFSLAVGAEVMWFDFHQEKATNSWAPGVRAADIDAKLDGDSYGFGGNIALHYKPNNTWAFGLTYKSRVKQSVSGKIKFKRQPGVPLPATWFENSSAEGDIVLPDSFGLGIMFRPYEKLTLEANAIYSLWSTYDELKIKYKKDLTPGNPAGPTKVSAADKKWEDVWRFQIGAEYDLTDLIDVRLGYVYDQIPDRDKYADYMTPTSHRHIINAGLGLNWEKVSVDLSYSFLWFNNRSIDGRPEHGVVDSRFKEGKTHLTGVSLTYRF